VQASLVTPIEGVVVMTSKRLGILVVALVVIWSLTGLGWFALDPGAAPNSITTWGVAHAGDPDHYVGGSEGEGQAPPDNGSGGESSDNPSDEREEGDSEHIGDAVSMIAAFIFWIWF
jgi:hypothetical protein